MFSFSRTMFRRRTLALAVAGLALGALTACGSEASDNDSDSAAAVGVTDAWVKAIPADEEMTAAFGVLTNESDEDVTLVSATTPAAGMVELHEVVMKDGEMVMQPKEGGITVPANGTSTLEPGGDHIMLMDVTDPIEPGDVVELELEFSDGNTLTMQATAKEFSGAEEDYQSGDSMGDG
jgi:copper(I)-binding protein